MKMRGSIIAALNALPSVDCSRHKAEAEKPLKHLGCIYICHARIWIWMHICFAQLLCWDLYLLCSDLIFGFISVMLGFWIRMHICFARIYIWIYICYARI